MVSLRIKQNCKHMQIKPVNDSSTEKCFLNVPRKIYAGDPNWACPLDSEIQDIFIKARNKKLEFGEAQRWILTGNSGELLGRIAAFYDKRRAFKEKPYSGGIGFFECIDDFKASHLLFNTARDWLKARNIEAMDGPINFGENYVNQGLLVEGFMPQGYGMPYNKPYYKQLFEEYGFRTFFEMYSYHSDLTKPYSERQVKFARHIAAKNEYQFDHFRFSNADKYLKDIIAIYNGVWSHFHDDYIPLEYDEVKKMMMEARPVIKEEFIWFIYHNQKPVGMLIVFPDINQILRKLNGKLDWWGKLRFAFAKLTTRITRARLVVTGILPDYQQSGVIASGYIQMVDTLRKHGIKELEASWIGDYNKRVNKIFRLIGAKKAKTHITYRYLFDKDAEFHRFMVEE